MKIIKRNGSEAEFNLEKIRIAVTKANNTVPEHLQMKNQTIEKICQNVHRKCKTYFRAISVEEIQDMVEDEIMNQEFFEVARNYITYRYKRSLARKANSTDDQILSLIECNNEEVKQENSNKNPTVASVQRDYVAGEVSKDLARRILLPEDIVAAHDAGIIHMHDLDYYMQRIFNCCLINLKDMLDYTSISEIDLCFAGR